MAIQTVLGPVRATDLGHVQMHEHLFCDLSTYVPTDKRHNGAAIELTNYFSTRVDRENSFDMVLDEPDLAVAELRDYCAAGGTVLVEATSRGLGRSPEELRQVSLESGVHVVMGSGYYVSAFHPPQVDEMSENEIFTEIVADLQTGIGPHKIRAGIIGEIGMTWPPHDNEVKVLRAAARSQRRTGAPLLIHPGRSPDAPAHHLSIVQSAGGILSRTVICHIDRTLFSLDEILEVASSGCVLEFDLFGTESSFYPPAPEVDLPNDGMRVEYIRQLVQAGFGTQVVIAEDVCRKTQLKKYGGEGYEHILRRVVPLMLRRGFTREQVLQITHETPRTLLNWA